MDQHRPGSGAGAATAGQTTLYSYRVGALPILQRPRLEEFLRDRLPREDRRCRIATATGLVILVKNLLLSHEPLYGLGEWAARYAPELLGLSHDQLASLNDDRVGWCLDGLFRSDCPSLALAVAAHAVREFDVELDELHNDSTTVTFHGAYADAAVEKRRNGRPTAAITWGHKTGAARPPSHAAGDHLAETRSFRTGHHLAEKVVPWETVTHMVGGVLEGHGQTEVFGSPPRALRDVVMATLAPAA
jgi:hypothetical protein